MKKKIHILMMLLTATLFYTACRHDEFVQLSDSQQIGGQPNSSADGDFCGMYVLCEGNMGSNKASVDYLFFGDSITPSTYYRNIYAERNPNSVKELGDVGNDIKVYGSQLWIVVNCSNKVEVASAADCRKKGKIDIPNCRYVAFADGYAYVSSYVGPVQMSGDAPLGRVYQVDTLTLQKVDSVVVGYQPEEMAVIGNRLYVANSGGYRAPNYDCTVSVIDLDSFTEIQKIEVAPNLHRLRADKYGQLWVSSRGDNSSQPSQLYVLAPDGQGGLQTPKALDVRVSDFCIVGDSLFYIGADYHQPTSRNALASGIISVKTHQTLRSPLTDAPQLSEVEMAYAIAVNPLHRDFYIMDAKNYVSSGQLLHFLADGTYDWTVWTGDIPCSAAFVGTAVSPADEQPADAEKSRYIQAVDEYCPAPGQFVNLLPRYDDGDTEEDMIRKCTEALAGGNNGTVTLGAYGGYITFHFDHPIVNVSGELDFFIRGNTNQGGAEPGVVMVSVDDNGNGKPDDTWYELQGSAEAEQAGELVYNYSITYQPSPMQSVPWTDSRGQSGTVDRNGYHTQEYYPLWHSQPLTFTGTLLPSNAENRGTETAPYWYLSSFSYGYADNLPNRNREGCSFDIGWAVDAKRQPVHLPCIHFVRVYTGVNQKCGWIGETSTEVTGAEDLHLSEE